MYKNQTTRFSKQQHHNQFGIFKWFALRGITDEETIKVVTYSFLKEHGYKMEGFDFSKGQENAAYNYVGDIFQKFATYAGKYLLENNYLKLKK